MLIDGHGLAFRAFYAVPMLKAEDGTPTNVITGFMNMLERLEKSASDTKVDVPDKKTTCERHSQASLFDAPKMRQVLISPVTVVFDAPCKTFRHEEFPEYKQQRKPSPPEFKPQIPILADLLQMLGYPVIMIEGVEADDTIASASRLFCTSVVSSDKDLLQILRPGVEVMRPVKGVSTFARYDEGVFREQYGFDPCYMPDYLALLGDTADNLPGVPGIGEKSALSLISEYNSLENIFENIEKLKPSHKKTFSENREQAFACRGLNRLKFDVPLQIEMFERLAPDYSAAFDLAERLSLRQLCNRIRILEMKTA